MSASSTVQAPADQAEAIGEIKALMKKIAAAIGPICDGLDGYLVAQAIVGVTRDTLPICSKPGQEAVMLRLASQSLLLHASCFEHGRPN